MRTSAGRVVGRGFLFLICLCVPAFCGRPAAAAERAPRVVCLSDVAEGRRQALSESLRAITGWRGLHFDSDGLLRLGDAPSSGGSPTARALLDSAQTGPNLIFIEDASGRADVVFGRVSQARLKSDANRAGSLTAPAFLVQIDFADFAHVTGDEAARAAFNAGWVLLHEISHVVGGTNDAERAGEAGDCEALVNLMRRECDLAVRAEYHFRLFPGQGRGEFRTRYVRLAFELPDPATNRRRRLWLMWDAGLVGGLPEGGDCDRPARAAAGPREARVAVLGNTLR
ncbi:MAG TPA: hypothetical protein VEY09_03835 [Pyrinomonadaceae bacterium]|nr:hypothetical protein [Pyrinomonadaceae bacterium]